MARTNQGVFKQLSEESRRLNNEYNVIISRYQDDPSSMDFFSDLAYASDYLYKVNTHS